MNIIFGCTCIGGDNSPQARIENYLRRTFSTEPVVFGGKGTARDSSVGYISDGGSVVGISERQGRVLIYIGAIYAPSPGWPSTGSPMDDPNATAAHLLQRYVALGEAFLDGVNGQYAIALVDPIAGKLISASDPFAGRNLFVFERDGQLLFSSNLRVLAEALGDDLQIDREYEDFLLIYGFYPFGRTPYRGIRTQGPGEMLVCCGGSMERVLIKARISLEKSMDAKGSIGSKDEAIEALYEAFLKATSEMLPSRSCKVAVLLGGFDSALVASMIRHLGYDVETYSFFYRDRSYNQPHTDTVANHLGITHHWVEIEQSMFEEGLKTFSETFNQPTNWPNYVIQTAHLCQRISAEGMTFCYSGDGCDAAFLGYPGTYRRARLLGILPEITGSLHRLLLALASVPWLERRLGHPYRVFLGLLRALCRSEAARNYLSFRVMDEITLKQLRCENPASQFEPIDAVVERLSAPHAKLPAMRRAYLGKAAVSPNRTKLIGSADASGVLILSPYLHPDLKRFALSLPVEFMRPEVAGKTGSSGKYILMAMAQAKDLLPPEVIFQPKVAAVDAPIDAWYAGPMRGPMREIMRGLPFDFDENYVDRLLDEKIAETLFKHFFMTDKVISHAASLLATYAGFTEVLDRRD